MDNYRKVEYMLYNYKNMQAEIDNMKLKIKEIEKDYRGTGAICYEEKSSPTNAFNSSVENEVIHKNKKVTLISNEIEYKQIQLDKIDNAIGPLEPREKTIIYMKYFDKKSNRDIAAKLNLTEVYICRLKKRIINTLIQLILN